MLKPTLLAAAAAFAISLSPAMAAGPTVLTDAQMDNVVGGTTLIRTEEANLHIPGDHDHEVPPNLVAILDAALGCGTGGVCRLPHHAPGNSDAQRVAFTDIPDL